MPHHSELTTVMYASRSSRYNSAEIIAILEVETIIANIRRCAVCGSFFVNVSALAINAVEDLSAGNWDVYPSKLVVECMESMHILKHFSRRK